MIAVVRLACPDVNIAATTALQAMVPDGRERGLGYGANVTMPNLTPVQARGNYQLYDGKPCMDEARERVQGLPAGPGGVHRPGSGLQRLGRFPPLPEPHPRHGLLKRQGPGRRPGP